jgi:hypothetical protein
MLGWVVVWYHAPHHICGGIVCSRACSLCAWALTLGSVLSRTRSWHVCVRTRSLMASCPLVSSLVASCARMLALPLACTRHRVRVRQ